MLQKLFDSFAGYQNSPLPWTSDVWNTLSADAQDQICEQITEYCQKYLETLHFTPEEQYRWVAFGIEEYSLHYTREEAAAVSMSYFNKKLGRLLFGCYYLIT
jgi:hypothetical protein